MTTYVEPTFSAFDRALAIAYTRGRGSYPTALYEAIFEFHAQAWENTFGTLLDVGCGPGSAVRDAAVTFKHAIGIDPAVEMINEARRLGGKTYSGEDIRFEVCAAERLMECPGVEGGSVDVIIAAMAAHWFDMSQFWRQAVKVLKPEGTVALWTCASLYCHPITPNAAEVQKILFKLEREILAPYELPGNRISRDLYDNLPLPWQVGGIGWRFDRRNLGTKKWDCNGILSNGTEFFNGGKSKTLSELELSLNTASMVVRWREAHPKLANTDEDCVKVTIEELRKALDGVEELRTGNSTVLLLFKKPHPK